MHFGTDIINWHIIYADCQLWSNFEKQAHKQDLSWIKRKPENQPWQKAQYLGQFSSAHSLYLVQTSNP